METGKNTEVARRGFLGALALASAAGLLPSLVRAQTASAVGIKPADLPDLTIKAVKVYVTASGRLASVTTASGVEGVCTLQTRVFHANWDNSGWLSYARRTLTGKDALDHLQFTSQYSPAPALRPTAGSRGHRHLSLGPDRQGCGPAGLPGPGGLQGPRARLRQLAAPADENSRSLRRGGVEGERRGLPCVQDQSAPGRGRWR